MWRRGGSLELPDQDGEPVRLSSLRGRPVVLYFYPKADTPGCTTQACGLRDHLPDYDEAGAVMIGVSPDPVARVKRFHDRQSLNFRLLADEDHSISETYASGLRRAFTERPSGAPSEPPSSSTPTARSPT